MPAFHTAQLSTPVALVSVHPAKARQVAEVYGIEPQNIYDYQNFDRIAENDQIEAVYIILPNTMHAEFTLQRLFMQQGDDQMREFRLEAVDQFAAEMDHFSDCVLHDQAPRTPGELGLADVRIVAAIYAAARMGKPMAL